MSRVNIISLSFNKDLTHFLCCTTTGVQIFELDPLVPRQNIKTGGVLSCRHIGFCYFFAIIHSSKYSEYSEDTLMIYNYSNKDYSLKLKFKSVVLSLRVWRNTIIVVTTEEIFMLKSPTNTKSIRNILNLKTRRNPMGLCEVTPLETSTQQIIAYPGYSIGSINIVNILNTTTETCEREPSISNAHNGEISFLAINQLGTLIASAGSEKVFIKIWDTRRKINVAVVRRSDRSPIYCMNFSQYSELLCCSSVKGIIEIFALKQYDISRQCSPLPCTAEVDCPCCQAPKSLDIFQGPPKVGCICTFLTINTVAAIYLDGMYYKFEFSNDGSTRGVNKIIESRMLTFK